MSILELTVDRFLDENDDGPLYGVRFTITRGVSIPKEVFVYRTDTGLYSHVASPEDLLNMGADRATAQTLFEEFYRSNRVEFKTTNKRRTAEFDLSLRARIDDCVLDWDDDDQNMWPRTDLLVLNTDQT